MTTIYLCRHGETIENTQRILQGHLPGHLTENGIEQAKALGTKLKQIHYDILICSDLQRCIDTTRIAMGDNADITIEPMLRERDWGNLTGMTIDFARTQSLSTAESIEELLMRAERLLTKWLQLYNDKTIIAIGHGLTNRAIIAVSLGIDIGQVEKMSNAEVRRLEITSPLKLRYTSAAESGATEN